MTILDRALLPAVFGILADFGKDMDWLVADTAAVYDPITGDVVKNAPTTFTVKSLPPGDFSNFFADKATIRQTDLQTGVAGQGLAFEPTPGTSVVFDGREYLVERVQPVYSGESVTLWLANLRRGGGEVAP